MMTAEEFKALCLPLGQQMLTIALRVVKNDEAARDVVQDAYERLWRHRDRLAQADNLAAYCLTTTRHTALEHWRDMQHWEDKEPTTVACEEQDMQETDRNHRAERAMQMVTELPDDVKTLFRLRYVEGLTSEQIALRVGKTADNVRAILSRQTKKIREQLNKSR